MKKAINSSLLLIMLLMSLPLLVSCSGISQEKYDKANSDLTTAQAQIQKLQGDLLAKDNELKAVKVKLDKVNSKIEILNDIFIPAITGELNNKTQNEMADIFLGWRDKVNAIGDPTLTEKFQMIVDSGGSNDATNEFFKYLLEDIEKTVK